MKGISMSKGIKYLVVGLAATGLAMSAHAANITVNFGAGDVTGISLAGGTTPLPVGDLIEVGAFLGTPPTVGSSSLANFVVFGTTLSGSGGNPGGFFAGATTASEAGFGHSNLFIVAFNNATGVGYTQLGIWGQNSANWVFPKSTDIPSSTTVDMEQLVNNPGNSATFAATTVKVFGRSPQQSADFGGSTYLPLQLVPEPSTWMLVGTGLIGLLGLRRRRS